MKRSKASKKGPRGGKRNRSVKKDETATKWKLKAREEKDGERGGAHTACSPTAITPTLRSARGAVPSYSLSKNGRDHQPICSWTLSRAPPPECLTRPCVCGGDASRRIHDGARLPSTVNAIKQSLYPHMLSRSTQKVLYNSCKAQCSCPQCKLAEVGLASSLS